MVEILITTYVLGAILFIGLPTTKSVFSWSVLIQIMSSVVCGILIYQYTNNLSKESWTLFSEFALNNLSILMLLTIVFVANMAILYSYSFISRESKNGVISFDKIKLFYILTNLFIPCLILVIASNNIALSWLGIELSTLTSIFLVGFYIKKTSIEAAWKYFIINSIGVTIALFGLLLLVVAATPFISSDKILSFTALLENAGTFNPLLVKIAFVMVFIGFGTKFGLVPMHTWLPDAHSKAITPISGILSSVLLPTALFVILKVKAITDVTLGNASFTSNFMIVFGTISILYAGFLILTQRNYKRLLAYSSIEHMGILSILFALNTPIAIFFACYHYVFHALAKSALFFASGNIFLSYHTTKIERVYGIIKRTPITGFLFLGLVLIIIGFPPFGIFTTELGLFSEIAGTINSSSINLLGLNNNPLIGSILLAIVMLGLVLASIGFLRSVIKLSLNTEKKEYKSHTHSENIFGSLVIVIILVVLLLISFDFIPFIKDLIKNFAINPL